MTDDVVAALRAAGCVFAEDEAALLVEKATSATELDHLVARRVAGEPLEVVVGWAGFCGLRIPVDPGVFVPRRRTELLARRATWLTWASSRPVVVDMCCGTGAIGAVILHTAGLRRVELHAADLEAAAVRNARRTLGGRARVHQGDLYAALPPDLCGRVDVLVANVPYVPTGSIARMPPEARLHEPRTALDGGPAGLDVARRLVRPAPEWLAPGGHVLFEVGASQRAEAVRLVEAAGLAPSTVEDDDLGTAVVGGQVRAVRSGSG